MLVSSWLLPSQATGPSIGFVLSKDGPWQLNGVEVKTGQALPPGATLLLAPSATFDSGRVYALTVVLMNNEARPLRCYRAEDCRKGLTLPASLSAEPTLASRISDVFRLIFERADRYVGLMSRGGTRDQCLPDGVVRFDNSTLALAPLFERLAMGRYRLQFEAVGAATGAPAPALDITWNQNAAPVRAPSGLAPALYRVTLSRPGDAAFEPCESWVLLADASTFGSASASFDAALAATRTWGPAVPPRDVGLFLHAYLADLARRAR